MNMQESGQRMNFPVRVRHHDHDYGAEICSEGCGCRQSCPDDVEVKIRLIDCVGYMVDGASGILKMMWNVR